MYHFFNYKNTRVRYSVNGKGSAVVLLHGFLEDSTMWLPFIKELSKRNKIICIDLLGHGASKNIGYVHTMEEQAQLVKAILRHLRLRNYFLIGHSMGGYIALAFAEMYSSTIKGLCLLNSTALADTEEKKMNRDRAIKAVKQHHKTFIRIAIPNLFSEANRKIFTTEIATIIKEALLLTPQGIVASLEGMKIRKDHTHLLKTSIFKKMLIVGKKDPVLKYETLINQVRNTDVKVVEFNDGHMSHIENKEALLQALKGFIKSR